MKWSMVSGCLELELGWYILCACCIWFVALPLDGALVKASHKPPFPPNIGENMCKYFIQIIVESFYHLISIFVLPNHLANWEGENRDFLQLHNSSWHLILFRKKEASNFVLDNVILSPIFNRTENIFCIFLSSKREKYLIIWPRFSILVFFCFTIIEEIIVLKLSYQSF